MSLSSVAGEIHIRTMVESDAESVCDAGHSHPEVRFLEWETPEVIARAIARNEGIPQIAICEARGTVVGFVLAGHDGIRAGLHHLWVRPGFHRRGIASIMVDRAIEALRNSPDGVRRLRIASLKKNKAAVKFWLSKGFTRTSGRFAVGQVVVSFFKDM